MDMSLSSLRRHFTSQKPESRQSLEKSASPAEDTITMATKVSNSTSAPVLGGNIARFALEAPEMRDALRRHLLAKGVEFLPHDKGASVLKADIAAKKSVKSKNGRTP